ncbi:unnamed protein product, partial [Candidula unifasciata]
MLDMFYGLQIFMWTIIIVIVLGKFIVLVSAESVQHAAVSPEKYYGHGALNYSLSNSRVLYGTSEQIGEIQELVSAEGKNTNEKLLQNHGITDRKPDVLNGGMEIPAHIVASKLVKEDRLHIATSEEQLLNRNEVFNSAKGKHKKRSPIAVLTKYNRTDIWNLLFRGFHHGISDTSKGSVVASSPKQTKMPLKLVRIRKRDASNRKNNHSPDKKPSSNNTISTQHQFSFNDSWKENVAAVDDIDKNVVEIPNVDVNLSRRQRQVPSVVVPITSNRNTRAREEGDVIIGAIFPLHNSPAVNNTYSRQCGLIWETYGIQRVEAFLMAVESINRNPLILPHVKLGWDIRDSCWYSPIALENSIDFIKDAIASQSNINNANPSVPPSTGNDSPANCRGNKHLKPIIGLVGPGSSEATIQVQNLLQIFNIPQIGYSATSHDLSDKNHYRYFLRVVPPDSYQAQALVDILLKCNWTYVSTVHTDGNYGLKGITEFTDLAKSKGICIAVSDGVAGSASDEEYDNILAKLLEDQNASVVVCFCEGETVLNLFRAIKRRRMERRLLIIGSDGWGNRMDVVTNLEVQAAGAISIMFHSPQLKDFRQHYENLKPHNNSKNPWFSEFWEERFQCSLDGNNMNKYHKRCW